MTADPLAFLHATLTATQKRAEAAGGDEWTPQDHPSDTVAIYDSKREPVVYDEGWPSREQVAHIVGNSPAAVLRRISADRKLLDRHAAIDCKEFGCDCRSCCATCRWTENDERGTEQAWGEPTRHAYPCPTIRLIAEGWGWTEEAT